MKNPLKVDSTTKKNQVFTILVLTSILFVSSEFTLVESSYGTINNIAPKTISQFPQNSNNRQSLPQSVIRAIVKDLSRRQGIPENKFKLVSYSQRTWRNGCLGVTKPDELCTQALVDGWKVIVTDGNQKWVYHTNINGNSLRLASGNIPTDEQIVNLPNHVKDAVLTTAAERLHLPPSELVIIQVKKHLWRNGCLELARPNQACTTALVPGWRIIIGAKEQVLVYHLNQTGSLIKLNEQASEINTSNLPSTVGDAVIKDASQRLGIKKSQLRITKFEPITTDGCLNLPDKNELCSQIAVKAWQVSVVGGRQRLVYHARSDGKQVRLNVAASQINLHSSVTRRVLHKASQVSGFPKKSLRIVKSQPKQWENISRVKIPGWQVVVATEQRNLIFLSDRRGNVVKLVNNSAEVSRHNLPEYIANQVLAQASRDARLPVSQLRIVTAKPQLWSDSCLEIDSNSPVCNPELVKGWQVIVSDGRNQWVYRVGEVVKIKLDPNYRTGRGSKLPAFWREM